MTANPLVYEGGACNDGSYMSEPIFVLKAIDSGLYYVSRMMPDRVGFLTHEWLDGAWTLWPVNMDAPAIVASFSEEANLDDL